MQQHREPTISPHLVGLWCFDCSVFVSLHGVSDEPHNQDDQDTPEQGADHCTSNHSISHFYTNIRLVTREWSLFSIFVDALFCTYSQTQNINIPWLSSTVQVENPAAFAALHWYSPNSNWDMFPIVSIPVVVAEETSARMFIKGWMRTSISQTHIQYSLFPSTGILVFAWSSLVQVYVGAGLPCSLWQVRVTRWPDSTSPWTAQ